MSCKLRAPPSELFLELRHSRTFQPFHRDLRPSVEALPSEILVFKEEIMDSMRHQPRGMTIVALDNLYESAKKRRIDGGPGATPDR